MKEKTQKAKAAMETINLYGGVEKFAAELSKISGKEYTVARVSNWRRRGIPPEVQLAFAGRVIFQKGEK